MIVVPNGLLFQCILYLYLYFARFSFFSFDTPYFDPTNSVHLSCADEKTLF